MNPQHLVEEALDLCRRGDAVVLVDVESDANLRWANNTLTTNGTTRSHTVTVVSFAGGGSAVVSREGATTEDLPRLVAEAEEAAGGAGPAEDSAPLLEAARSAGDWGAPPADTSIAVFERFAPALGESFRRATLSRQSLYGFAYHRMTTTFVGSSTGLRSRHDQPTGHAEINAKSADLARSTWVGVPSVDFTDVDVPEMHDELDRRLGWAARRLDLPAGRYDTVLPPSAVADLMIYTYWSAEGRRAHEGRTVFSRPGGGTRVGERIVDVPLTLRSDPHAAGLACAPFLAVHRSGSGQSVFDNGAVLQPTEWISAGRLEALVQSRHTSALTGLPFTPYIDNLILEAAEPAGGLADLVAGVDRGLLLTCLWYIREVDPQTLLLTGLTRDGVYLVEGGEVVGAVNNFRFNESPLDVLSRSVRVGATERTLPREWSDWFTRTAMPALHVAGFNMSSVSPAH